MKFLCNKVLSRARNCYLWFLKKEKTEFEKIIFKISYNDCGWSLLEVANKDGEKHIPAVC